MPYLCKICVGFIVSLTRYSILCPHLTHMAAYKNRFDLAQPVADSVGNIYEKVSILEYVRKEIARHGGPVKCPMQGV